MFIVVALTILFFGVAVRKLVALTMLMRSGEETMGQVDDVHGRHRDSRRSSAQISYSFTVQGVRYEGYASGSGNEVPRIGAEIPVTYLPSHPSVNLSGSGATSYEFPLGSILAGLLFALLSAFKIWHLRQPTRSEPTEPPET